MFATATNKPTQWRWKKYGNSTLLVDSYLDEVDFLDMLGGWKPLGCCLGGPLPALHGTGRHHWEVLTSTTWLYSGTGTASQKSMVCDLIAHFALQVMAWDNQSDRLRCQGYQRQWR